jgi:hypothetical protein
MVDQKVIVDLYVRTCRDSGFRMLVTDAAKITAHVLGIHPLSVMGAINFNNMRKIAAGEHPACHSPALTSNNHEGSQS